MIREQILETAIKTVCQDRQDRYGAVENNFQMIAEFWSTYLNAPVTAVGCHDDGNAEDRADQNREVYAG